MKVAEQAPAGAIDARALREAVDEMKRASRGAQQFSAARGPDPARPELITIDLTLKWLDHLEHEWQLEVTIPYSDACP